MRPTFRKVYGRPDPQRAQRIELIQAGRRLTDQPRPEFRSFLAYMEQAVLAGFTSEIQPTFGSVPIANGKAPKRTDREFAQLTAQLWEIDDPQEWIRATNKHSLRSSYTIPPLLCHRLRWNPETLTPEADLTLKQ